MDDKKETALEVSVQEQLDILLIIAVGNSKFKRVVGAISKIIIEENLDIAPDILKDLLKYISNIEFMEYKKETAQEVSVQEQSNFIPEDSNGKHYTSGKSIPRPY